MKESHLLPEECLVIEDSERGLIAAQQAGCDAIWIKTPFNEMLQTQTPFFCKITHQEFLESLV